MAEPQKIGLMILLSLWVVDAVLVFFDSWQCRKYKKGKK